MVFRVRKKECREVPKRRKGKEKESVGCFGVAIWESLLVSWFFPCMVYIVSKVVHKHCNHDFDISLMEISFCLMVIVSFSFYM